MQRPHGMERGTTIEAMADATSNALASWFDGPVPIVGMSTGTAIALALANHHPAVVERLVVVAGACRLADVGRTAQREMLRLIEDGRPGPDWAALAPMLAGPGLGGRAMAAFLRVMGPSMTPDDPSDLVVTLEAEDRFDGCDRRSPSNAKSSGSSTGASPPTADCRYRSGHGCHGT